MKKDTIIDDLIAKLEVFAKEYDLLFVWARERRPDGCFIIQFKRKNSGINQSVYTLRITHDEMLSANGNAGILADRIIEAVKSRI